MNLTDGDLAIRELRRAGATGRAESVARAAMDNVWPLYSGHFDELTRTVEALPSALLERYPVLRIFHRMTPVLARSTRPFKPLVHPDDARAMSSDARDILTLVQIVAFRLSGDVAAALIYARRLEERILEHRGEPRDLGPTWFYYQQIGSTFLAAGDTTAALRHFGTARRIGQLTSARDAERSALGRAALAHAVHGSFAEAEDALRDARQQPPATTAHATSTLLTEQTTHALLDVERMTPDAESRLAALEPYDSAELTWPFALLARTRFLLSHHRPEEAIEAVRLAHAAHRDQHGSFASDVINAASIEALWGIGDIGGAQRLAESAGRTGTLTNLAIARLALLQARAGAAMQIIQQLPPAGPATRAQLILLRAWTESATKGGVEPETARQVARLAGEDRMRRSMSTVPVRVLAQVRECLPSPDAAVFDTAVAGLTLIDHPRPPVLTAGELRVLNALTAHPTTASIAMAFHVSPNTIKTQLRSLYRKLDCSTREEAVATASRFRLLTATIDRGR